MKLAPGPATDHSIATSKGSILIVENVSINLQTVSVIHNPASTFEPREDAETNHTRGYRIRLSVVERNYFRMFAARALEFPSVDVFKQHVICAQIIIVRPMSWM